MFGLASLIMTVLHWAAIAFGAFAVVHAVRQRPDAFTAVDKLTKPIWLGILAVAIVVLFLTGPISMLGVIGIVAVGVYMADVRPKVDEVQRGPRW